MAKEKKKKKIKLKEHVTYNKKIFLAPNSINSMAAIFTKIYKNGIAIIRISDCNNTIKLWNDLNDPSQVKEMIEKIENIEKTIAEFKKQVLIKLPNQ